MLSRDPLFLNVLEDILRDLKEGKPLVVQAPREPVVLIAARELLILDEDQAIYRRAYAWWKNVQVWASLRFNDH